MEKAKGVNLTKKGAKDSWRLDFLLLCIKYHTLAKEQECTRARGMLPRSVKKPLPFNDDDEDNVAISLSSWYIGLE